ncbi:MAG: UDP-N-acetylglucosamine 2-epimerase (hydrolyzing) [Elusimicrobia bacterium]|nr:UDP-N-acetylglucosamine 2-epimerase (hydrolyzing) [Elusimicrobiota bacterium]
MIQTALVTSARSDLGYYLPLMKALRGHPRFQLRIVATGMHLSNEYGGTVESIREAGFKVAEEVPSLLASDAPQGVVKTMGAAMMGFADLWARLKPDLIIVFGDRFDMYPAALSALPFRIPVAHMAGGELTQGAIDDALRHSLTKLSHLHFVAIEEYRRRLMRMGEEPWRVTVSGSLAVDHIRISKRWTGAQTARHFGFILGEPSALITYHPETLDHVPVKDRIESVLRTIEGERSLQCLFTYPNADAGGRSIIEAIERFCSRHPKSKMIKNAGPIGYFSLMSAVNLMVGNSSSGIVEAPSFQLPVVNIGKRQDGRMRAANVIDCDYDLVHLRLALRRAQSQQFRRRLSGLRNPYGDGQAASRIVERLARISDFESLILKKFYSAPSKRQDYHELQPA